MVRMGAVITSEAELWLVWWLCSSAKARRNSVIRKNLKELKWSRAGSCCTLLLLIAKPRLSPPLGSADHTCKNSQHLVSIFSIWNCWSRRGTQERGVTSLGAGGPSRHCCPQVVTFKPHAQGLNVTERQILTSDRVWRNSCGYFQEFMN